MTTTQVAPPYPIFTDTDGSPLDSGYLYLGFVNMNPETNPIQVYWDEALTQPAPQPIRTVNGYPSRMGTPAVLYTDGTFSITIRNKKQEVVLYSPLGYAVSPSSVAASLPIITVANNINSVNTVAGNIPDINTVAGNADNIDTVAEISADVTAVAGVAADIPTVAANVTDIQNFADVYQGAKAVPPATRNDGSPLQLGDLYFDTALDQMRVYGAGGWEAAGSSVNGTAQRFRFVATAGQTTFSGVDSNGNTLAYDPGFIDVYLNGSRLDQTDFTATSGTSIVLASGASVGDQLNIVAYGTFDLANVGGEDVSFTQSGSGAVARNVQSKLRESVSVLDFGAIPNDSSAVAKLANDAAFAAAIASFTNNAAFAPYSGGGTVLVPQGTYYLSNTISISRQIILSGVTTPDGNAWTGSILVFPTGKTGIRVYDYRTSPAGTDAGGTTIQNLVIRTTRSGAVQEAGYHGVHSDTRFTIRNCVVTLFGDTGINIVATAGGTPNGNANNWRIDNVRCAENGYDGLYIDGADVNAGVAIRLDCSSNLRWGIFDSSFLGNTYVGCHTASNGTGAYKTDNANARNVFLGCYSESGQGASELVTPTLVLGGIHAAGFSAGSTAQILGDNGLKAADGTVASPSVSLASDQTTGFYRISAGVFGWASGGVNRGRVGNGFAKWSTDGTYWSSSQVASEFVQTSTTVHSSIDYIKSSAYTGVGKYIKADTAAGTGFNLLTAANAGGATFQILGNGNAQNTNNSYGAISDIKLKENIAPAPSYWDKFKKYEFVNYTLKADPDAGKLLGVVAQQAEQVSGGVVYEVPDYEEIETPDEDGNPVIERIPLGTVTKNVKYSVITLQAEVVLQEAQRRIEEIEARLLALESKT